MKRLMMVLGLLVAVPVFADSGELNGTSETGPWVPLPRGAALIKICDGTTCTFGGGTVTLQVDTVTGGTPISVEDEGTAITWTAGPDTKPISLLGSGERVRLVLSGGTDAEIPWEIRPLR